jgi:diadenosine tetraphosphatase ApaH/serine/threonine PP2A family protein phosphatase
MRIALVSDIHSNLVALETVLGVLPAYDQLWCLGDTIGYGPRPNECLAHMRERGTFVLTGNHDLACLGEVSLADFNALARTANEWNNRQLLPELRAYLHERPATLRVKPDATLAHASPRDPIWEYILDVETALDNLRFYDTQLCLVGHSHVPTIFALHEEETRVEFAAAQHKQTVQLRPGSRYIFNPGSVGQPRDGDPRAAYAIWDTEAATFRFERVPYDIAATQRQMRAAGLPAMLADRLTYGH